MKGKRAKIFTTMLIGLAAVMLLAGCGNLFTQDQAAVTQLNSSETGNLEAGGLWVKDWYTGNGTYKYTNNGGGQFTVDYTDKDGGADFNVLCGKGWSSGIRNRVVSYVGDFNPARSHYDDGSSDYQNAMLTFYGWARSPSLTEYYVLESYGEYDPSQGTGNDKYNFQGVFTSAGNEATYHMYEMNRTDNNIDGYGPFHQIYSIRMRPDADPTDTENWSSKHREIEPGDDLKGVIYLGDHMDKWAKEGWSLSNFDHQAMIVEAYESSGHAKINVIEGDVTPVDTDPMPHITTPSGFPEKLVALKAKYNSKYLTANSSTGKVYADKSSSSSNWSKFYMVSLGGGKVAFRCKANGGYVCAEAGGTQQAVANRSAIDLWETFDIALYPGYTNVYTFQNNVNGKYGYTTKMGWYLRFDGGMQEYRGRGCQFYITYLN